jgi:hypothetical protein
MLLATFTFADATLTIVEFAFMLLWIWIAAAVILDIFASHDLSNGGKALWVLFVFALPLLGVLAYLIVRGHVMHEHRPQDRRPLDFRLFTHAPTISPPDASPADHLSKLADLHDHEVITDDEFKRAKARALA